MKAATVAAFGVRDPVGTRTQDPYIKSVLLYQLSYGISSFPTGMERKDMTKNIFYKSFLHFFIFYPITHSLSYTKKAGKTRPFQYFYVIYL